MPVATVNYYDELGLDRDATVTQIRDALKDLKLQLSSKAVRPSSQQEKWQKQLELVDQAADTFADEDRRTQYDVELRRASKSNAVETAAIDWTTRAWNYYFIGDNGAASVAARKAKEQAPDQAMPFVVSAWVELKDKEFKAAKRDADEAFVLDELTADTVDVQMVRGTVYFVLEDYERALASFDRALPKASPAEKSDLYWRKSTTHGAMRDYASSFEDARLGLSLEIEFSAQLKDQLETAICAAINELDYTRPDRSPNLDRLTTSVDRLTRRRTEISSSQINSASKAVIIRHIEENISLLQKHIAVIKERARLEAVNNVNGHEPAVPLVPIGVTAVLFFIMVGVFNASTGAGLVFLLLFAAMVAYVVSRFSKRTQWKSGRASFEDAQRRLAEVARRQNGMSSGPVLPPHSGR